MRNLEPGGERGQACPFRNRNRDAGFGERQPEHGLQERRAQCSGGLEAAQANQNGVASRRGHCGNAQPALFAIAGHEPEIFTGGSLCGGAAKPGEPALVFRFTPYQPTMRQSDDC